MLSLSILLLCGWLSALPALPQQTATRTLSTAEAKAHIGETAKVCGVIASIYEPRRSRRNPTFLNFDKPYPQTEFSAVIWRWQRPGFGDLKARIGKQACVTGQVRSYKGRAQITLLKAEQLSAPNP